MGITTKTGDKGMTSLLGGARIRKDHITVKAFSELDELCSILGLAKSLIKKRVSRKLLESVQKDLSVVCCEVAARKISLKKLKKRIDSSHIKKLEDKIHDLESKIELKSCFSLPGENPVSGLLDVARAITRKAEIHIVTLKNKNLLKNHCILIYLNRLSDLLYLLSRSFE
jgi:cob(I)alamin adenosyltransferase